MASKWFMFKVAIVKAVVSEETLAKQARKPSGWLGRNILKPMFVTGNAALNQFIFDLLAVQPRDKLLEIGFGPGVLIKQLCEQEPASKIIGLDFSPTMLKQAYSLNKKFIKRFQLTLIEGSSDDMPFDFEGFDSVFCANTLYFWQPPEPHLNEVFRVLKPGGKFVMGFRTGEQIDAMGLHPSIFARYTPEAVKALLLSIGFTDVSIESQSGFPVDSFCAVARKPLT